MGQGAHQAGFGAAVRAQTAGVFAETPIATPQGWRPAGSLRPGDGVLTMGNGPQTLLHLAHSMADPAQSPVFLPRWSLDNRDPLWLLPDQTLLIDTELADDLYGDPFALIPAAALPGWRGISHGPPDLASQPAGMIVHLGFARPEMIYASRAVLLACRGTPVAALHSALPPAPDPLPYSLAQARHLIACIMAQEAGGALRAFRQSQAATLPAPNRP